MGADSDQDLLRELAQRLIAYPDPRGQTEAELLPGAVPADASLNVVVPSGGRLIGSAVHRRDGQRIAVQVVIDVDQPIESAVPDYEQQLAGAGWEVTDEFFGGGGGFVGGGMPWRHYQRGRTGPSLMVSAQSLGMGKSELRLRFDDERPPRPPRHEPPPGAALMPTLYPPPGVRMEGGGGGGGDSSWYSQATAFTEMTPDDLEAYFSGQLVRAGWKRLTGASADRVVCSVWEVTQEEGWRGVLIVLASKDPGERWLQLHIQGPRGGRRGGGETVFSTLHRR